MNSDACSFSYSLFLNTEISQTVQDSTVAYLNKITATAVLVNLSLSFLSKSRYCILKTNNLDKERIRVPFSCSFNLPWLTVLGYTL